MNRISRVVVVDSSLDGGWLCIEAGELVGRLGKEISPIQPMHSASSAIIIYTGC